VPTVIFTTIFFVFAVGMGLRAQTKKVTTGDRGIVGETGTAKTDIGETGSVFVHGEFWNAHSDTKISANTKVQVVAVEGMKLKVKIASQKEVS